MFTEHEYGTIQQYKDSTFIPTNPNPLHRLLRHYLPTSYSFGSRLPPTRLLDLPPQHRHYLRQVRVKEQMTEWKTSQSCAMSEYLCLFDSTEG